MRSKMVWDWFDFILLVVSFGLLGLFAFMIWVRPLSIHINKPPKALDPQEIFSFSEERGTVCRHSKDGWYCEAFGKETYQGIIEQLIERNKKNG